MPAFLLDIEGTTTPISFVYDVLFPYARDRVEAYLERHATDDGVLRDLSRLRQEWSDDRSDETPPPPWNDDGRQRRIASAVAYVHWLMDRDRKSTGLKSLQGRIWSDGYREGSLRGQVFADVPRALRRWREQGRASWIFSSGSVLAQKLLFGHSDAGDLTQWLDGYFDTTTGPKKEASSYARIAAAMGHPPGRICFLSDVVAELDAAGDAGMRTVLCRRPGNVPVEQDRHAAIRSFDEIDA